MNQAYSHCFWFRFLCFLMRGPSFLVNISLDYCRTNKVRVCFRHISGKLSFSSNQIKGWKKIKINKPVSTFIRDICWPLRTSTIKQLSTPGGNYKLSSIANLGSLPLSFMTWMKLILDYIVHTKFNWHSSIEL